MRRGRAAVNTQVGRSRISPSANRLSSGPLIDYPKHRPSATRRDTNYLVSLLLAPLQGPRKP